MVRYEQGICGTSRSGCLVLMVVVRFGIPAVASISNADSTVHAIEWGNGRVR